MRSAQVNRKTKETDIQLSFSPDGGDVSVSTGIGFFDHMLTAFAVHGGFGLVLAVKGDLDVDTHHTVEDTGIGIPEEYQERVFERFFRVDKSHSKKVHGTGLGLSIAREIVLRHNGSIALTDHDGPGTTVRIVLPIRQEENGEDHHE